MTPRLAGSYAACDRLARREAGNFYPAFRMLPSGQRLAMCALYAFFRLTDDLGDGDDPPSLKRPRLAAWGRRLDLALAGRPSHRIHLALRDTVRRHAIDPAFLRAVVDGVESDLGTVRFRTFHDLSGYCYRVASVVGLSCLRIWGLRRDGIATFDEIDPLGVRLGIAFQLTNILRDLAEDARRDRVYLPQDELARFGYPEAALRHGGRGPAFEALMKFQVARARGYYDAAEPLARALRPAGRAVLQVMTRTYRGLLDAIEERNYDVFRERVRLPAWRKLGLAVQALPVRWGWA